MALALAVSGALLAPPAATAGGNGQGVEPGRKAVGERVQTSRLGALVVDRKGQVRILLSRAPGTRGDLVPLDKAIRFGRPGDVPFAGDWNGDGTATVGVFRPANGTWYLAGADVDGGGKVTVVPFGRPGDEPVIGGFGADPERDSIGVFRGGRFFLARTPAPGSRARTVSLGRAGDLPLVGDFDGDGRDDLGVWRPSTRVVTTPAGSWRMGQTGDRPVAADLSGAGRDSPGVYRALSKRFGLGGQSYWFGSSGPSYGFTFTP